MTETKEVFAAIDRYLRPLSFPVAIKLLDAREVPADARSPVKTFGYRMLLCQGIALARRFGWKIAFTAGDWACPPGASCFGFGETPSPDIEAGVAHPLYTATPEAGIALQAAMPRFPAGSGRAVLMAGPDRTDFDPDLIIIYGEPFQIARCIQGAIWEEGRVVNSEFAARLNCAYQIVRTLNTGDYQVVIPGGGERAFAATQDHELSFSVPRNRFLSFARGLASTHRAGANRIPTPLLSLRMQPELPRQYDDLARLVGIKEK